MADDTTSSWWKELPVVLVPTETVSSDSPEATSFCDLPAEVVIDILSRLPVKTLVSSTSVSKKWCSLIKTPSFISTHLALSLSKLAVIDRTEDTGSDAKGCILVTPTVCSEKPILSIFYDDKSCTPHSAVKIPFETCSRTVRIVGSCNGLVCLTDNADTAFGGDVYLYNPVVRKYRKLSDEFSCFVDWMEKGGATYPVLGFGYHEIDKDYRVVRILYSFHNVHHKLRPRAEVYSLRENKWRSVKAEIKSTAFRGCPTFFDGCIYWVAAEKPRTRITGLIWFDLRNEVFHEVKMPKDYDKDSLDNNLPVNLMRWNDSVTVAVVEPIRGCKMGCVFWVLKKDGDGKISWKKQLNFVFKENLSGLPVGFTWTGKLVVDAIDQRRRAGFCTKTAVLNLKDFNFCDLAVDGPHTIDTNFLESLVLFLE